MSVIIKLVYQTYVSDFEQLHAPRDDYKKAYLRHWNETASKTESKEPIDVLLCPCAPSASFPHDFLP